MKDDLAQRIVHDLEYICNSLERLVTAADSIATALGFTALAEARSPAHAEEMRHALGGFYCQNCSRVLCEKQGDICQQCRELLKSLSYSRYRVLYEATERLLNMLAVLANSDPEHGPWLYALEQGQHFTAVVNALAKARGEQPDGK